MAKTTCATVWLDGCSGCHMSFLDLDERLIQLGNRIDLVYSPLVDIKEYPSHVNVCLVEGAVSNEDDYHKIHVVRQNTDIIVAFGDCAVTTNVPGIRNPIGTAAVLRCAYEDNATLNKGIPREVIPPLLPQVLPVHHVIPVDFFLPGCPPSADLIWNFLSELLDGRRPDTSTIARFGK